MRTLVSVTGCDEPPVIPGGKYRLDALLGEGGMGEVWRAFNLQLEVPVAIKLLRSDLSSAELGERLRVEARAAAKLMHPGIVRVFDAGEARPGEPYIVMELLSGESLGDMIDRGPVAAVDAVKLMLPVVEALGLAHARGVVHRDLKPDNIFIAQEGGATQPKLLDFGIAKLTGDAQHDGPKLTQIGTLLGSPDYMSPEQARGLSDIDQRSDIWSLCVVLYEALSGQAPFLADNYPAQLRCIIEDVPAPLAVDTQLEALVLRGLAKDRERRYGSCQELGQALAKWLLAQGVEHDVTGASIATKWLGRAPRVQRPSPEPKSERVPRPRARRWMPKAAAALLALGAAGLGGKLLASPTTLPATPVVAAVVVSDAPPAAPVVEAAQLAPTPPAAPAPRAVEQRRSRSKPTLAAPAPTSVPQPRHDLIDPYR